MDYKYIQIMSLIVYTAVTTRLKFPVKDYIRIKHLKSDLSSLWAHRFVRFEIFLTYSQIWWCRFCDNKPVY